MGEIGIRLGVVGLGGWAGHMVDRLLVSEGGPDCATHLTAVCEPDAQWFPDRVAKLQRRGVAVVGSYNELLQQPIDAAYLPLPIHLHRPYTERALAAGKAVLCEKPAAGSVQDVDAMIQARERAGLPVGIAFQHVWQPNVHLLKRRLLEGEFGEVLECRILACWPRGEVYYARNGWAGRVRRDGRWILDSPANNAMAHFIHLGLFLLGSEPGLPANPTRVESELYRVNSIESYDTCSLRITVQNAVPLLIGLTHACAGKMETQLSVRTSRARIEYDGTDRIQIVNGSGSEEFRLEQSLENGMFTSFRDCVLGGPRAGYTGSLEMARAHTVAICAASEASTVHSVPAEFRTLVVDTSGGKQRAIRGIEKALRQSFESGCMLHESGVAPWSRPGRGVETDSCAQFAGNDDENGSHPVAHGAPSETGHVDSPP